MGWQFSIAAAPDAWCAQKREKHLNFQSILSYKIDIYDMSTFRHPRSHTLNSPSLNYFTLIVPCTKVQSSPKRLPDLAESS